MKKDSASPWEKLSPREEEHYTCLSQWAEDLDALPTSSRITKTDRPDAGRSLLEAALGSSGAVTRAVGRPSLGRAGTSPSRTVRLPDELDAALMARAMADHRRPSEIVRDALHAYLGNAS